MGLQIACRLYVVVMFLYCYETSPVHIDPNIANKISPKSYTLSFQIFPDEEVFTGEVIIQVVALESTNVISLNANKNLTVQDTEVVLSKSPGGTSKSENIQIRKTDQLDEENLFRIELNNAVNKGEEFTVKMKFSGKLNTHNTNGLFKKSFENAAGQPRWIIGSQLKPNLTSSVFPCFENPYFKVPFDVSIQRPSKVNSLSTMPLLRSVDMGNGWTQDKFLSTPPMAVSSLAIFVSDLTPASYNKPDLQIRIWAAPELLQPIKQNRNELIYNALNMYGRNFGVNYPLAKLDYIALPSSARISVTSGWGLIISSNSNLGCDSEEEKWTISSEMVGQWIGNLITPSLSDDVVATALGHFCGGYYNAKNFINENEYLLEMWPLSGMYANYYEFANPLRSDNAEIRRMSSTSKAVMVIRMVAYTLTERTFATGLKNFIKTNHFKTFEMDELWEALTKQAHSDRTLPTDMSVKDIVTPWLEYDRIPFLTVTRNYDANSALLTQRVFLRKRSYASVKDDLLWKIPIVLVQQNHLDFTNTKPMYWMSEKDYALKNVADKKKFIIINPEEIAEYMVNYDHTNWNMIADFLQSSERTKIPVLTRAKLVHDALNLAYAGILDFGTALNVTKYLKDETSYVPWRPLFIMFDHIGRHIDGTKVQSKFQAFVSSLSKPLYNRLKSDNKGQEKSSKSFMRNAESVFEKAADDTILKEANSAYEQFMQNPSEMYKNSSRYLCAIFEHGTKEQWEFGLNTLKHLPEDTEIERYYLLKTLVGCPKDSWKIKKFLHITLFEQDGAFTDDDFKYANFMLTGGAGYMAVFEYLKENWNALKARLQDKPEIWEQLIYTATNLYKTQDGLNQVTEFYNKHKGQFGAAETTIQNSLKKIEAEVKWTNENLSTLEKWLDDYIFKNKPQK